MVVVCEALELVQRSVLRSHLARLTAPTLREIQKNHIAVLTFSML
jgi:hypothetical protein